MWELRWIWGPWAHPEILNFACSIRVHAVFGLGALEIKAQCFLGPSALWVLTRAPHYFLPHIYLQRDSPQPPILSLGTGVVLSQAKPPSHLSSA